MKESSVTAMINSYTERNIKRQGKISNKENEKRGENRQQKTIRERERDCDSGKGSESQGKRMKTGKKRKRKQAVKGK